MLAKASKLPAVHERILECVTPPSDGIPVRRIVYIHIDNHATALVRSEWLVDVPSPVRVEAAKSATINAMFEPFVASWGSSDRSEGMEIELWGGHPQSIVCDVQSRR